MRNKQNLLTAIVCIAIAAVIAIGTVVYESATYGTDTGLLSAFISDGFFVSAVCYIGSAILIFISEAGNFYGLQYLGYRMVTLFSFRKQRMENRKDYFTYCMEKQARQKEDGRSSAKWVMLAVGIICLIGSLVMAMVFV